MPPVNRGETVSRADVYTIGLELAATSRDSDALIAFVALVLVSSIVLGVGAVRRICRMQYNQRPSRECTTVKHR
eukprot:4713212-Prymnesium_polylepis.2